MKKHSKFLKIAVVLSTLAILMIMSGCEEPDPDSESTWKFVNSSSYTISVSPWKEENTNTGKFTLSTWFYLNYTTVTWKGCGDTYCHFNYEPSDSVKYDKDYNSQTITFTNR